MGVDRQLLQELSPRAAQQTARGRVVIRVGWTLRVLGIGLGIAGVLAFRAGLRAVLHTPSDFVQPQWWLTTLGGLAVGGVGVYTLGTGRRFVVRGKQHTTEILDSLEQLAGTRYVLYLRPFSIDPELAAMPTDVTGGSAYNDDLSFLFASGLTHEEALIRRFGQFGRVIAIGRPGEQLPLLGAARAYLPLDDWQDTVSELISGAHVVILAAGPGAGTVWEYTEALRLLPPSRLVLLIFCSPADYDLFREASAEEYARRSAPEPEAPDTGAWPPLPDLPDFPPPFRPTRSRWNVIRNGGRKRMSWDFVLKGLIVFSPDWQPTFIRFDPTTLNTPNVLSLRRLVKREIKPVIYQLTSLPARD